MDQMSVLAVVFQSIPESVVLFSLAGAILGVRWELRMLRLRYRFKLRRGSTREIPFKKIYC